MSAEQEPVVLTEAEREAIACDCESASDCSGSNPAESCPVHAVNLSMWIDKCAADLLDDVAKVLTARRAEWMAEHEQAEAAIARIRALHAPFNNYGRTCCYVCLDGGTCEDYVDWPCPTIRALDG
jgi:hypothetical protein